MASFCNIMLQNSSSCDISKNVFKNQVAGKVSASVMKGKEDIWWE